MERATGATADPPFEAKENESEEGGINPPSVFRSLDHGFSQAVLASGRRTLYVSGQTAWDSEKHLIGGADLERQARQAFTNVQTVVEAAGGTLADVVSVRIYVVDYRPEKAAPVGARLQGLLRAARSACVHVGGRRRPR